MHINDALKGGYKINRENITVAGDGGTIYFELIDPEGELHKLFIDRRIGTQTEDHLYADNYPGADDSIDLGIREEILQKLIN